MSPAPAYSKGDRLEYRPVTGGVYTGTCTGSVGRKVGIQIDGKQWYVVTTLSRVKRKED